jgi:hypothetical protein
MRTFALCAVLMLFGSSIEANPFKEKKFWAIFTTSIASSITDTVEAHKCRERVGISFCSGGYGPFGARQGVNIGASIGFSFLGYWGERLGIKEAYGLPIAFTGYNAYDAYDQTLKGCPAGQWPVYGTKFTCTGTWGYDAKKPDLSHVSFVRR